MVTKWLEWGQNGKSGDKMVRVVTKWLEWGQNG